MKCFYHNDGDGKCAAYWVYKSAKIIGKRQEFIPMDYHIPFPFNTIEEDEEVFIVDYHIPPSEMDTLLKITGNVTWVDHHKSAMDKYADYPNPIRGVRVNGIAACMLSYAYFNHMTRNGRGDIKPFDTSMTEDAPIFTKLLADYDVWTFAYGDDTRRFQIAFNSHDITPTSHHWEELYNEETICQCLTDGIAQTRYRDTWARAYCSAKGFVAKLNDPQFEHHTCYAMNLGLCSSQFFDSVADKEYDILIPFSFDGTLWHYSFYSTRVDVSKIAVTYGGGGHVGASGCALPELILRKV